MRLSLHAIVWLPPRPVSTLALPNLRLIPRCVTSHQDTHVRNPFIACAIENYSCSYTYATDRTRTAMESPSQNEPTDEESSPVSRVYSSFRSSRAPLNVRGSFYTSAGLKAFAAYSCIGGRATALEVIIEAIHRTRLPGPLLIHSQREMIGRGSQFAVYKQDMQMSRSSYVVAVKVPMFTLDPNRSLSLANVDSQKHLRSIYLEVLALTNPVLKAHRNIARLIGWSYDSWTFNKPIYLVMELAHSNLRMFLQLTIEGGISAMYKYKLCEDVAGGLDVLHECGIIHGDLKPDNILVYQNGPRYFIAKLADFGLSLEEAISNPDMASLGGTKGWQAPEVAMGQVIDQKFWIHTDSYSYGLLVWSVMLLEGNLPPDSRAESRQQLALKQAYHNADTVEEGIQQFIVGAFQSLLNEEPSERTTELLSILEDWNYSIDPV